jgi:hypothetical protein
MMMGKLIHPEGGGMMFKCGVKKTRCEGNKVR